MNDSLMVSEISEIERAEFYRKTYMHVAVAILAFGAVEYLLLKTIPLEMVLSMVSGKYIWLAVIGVFWLASMLATKLSFSVSKNMQYLGLGLYVLIEAVIFLPMLGIASLYAPEIITQAALVTAFMFAGLTAAVFLTNKDFSFLRNIIVIGGFVALGVIVVGAIFGFNLGLWFSLAMVALASASILYETYNIKNQYSKGQYVGAALQLFASIMLLFWYILRVFLSRRD
ncbi:Bax inhibitor-1 family protein [Epilithonimonas sp. JDS]|uniref:Bax inhibitor-1/YccA family protein n=1 Tax=Epilithonimonas sp. JDS TaxID=2902797 RepID=UPI001E411FD7|nr:Bax inhibitor-1 family protein [Epilithonimonas sp. JDS]MCD9853718.1 Bax inhibitor-1 family protein [Epilithonimonas sp. JDS]